MVAAVLGKGGIFRRHGTARAKWLESARALRSVSSCSVKVLSGQESTILMVEPVGDVNGQLVSLAVFKRAVCSLEWTPVVLLL